MQCTADLLPADVVGTNVFNRVDERFDFRPGPIFANVVLVDEINRASPKTQSGLLECMQERRVTVDVQTHEIARPFIVLATQNPVEFEGTYPLPEAQVDRFMVRLSLGYPEPRRRGRHAARQRVGRPRRTGQRRRLGGRGARRPGRGPRASTSPTRCATTSSRCSRARARTAAWSSARARAPACCCCAASKARALLDGRDHALPDDVRALATAVLAHRIVLEPEAADTSPAVVIDDALMSTPAR